MVSIVVSPQDAAAMIFMSVEEKVKSSVNSNSVSIYLNFPLTNLQIFKLVQKYIVPTSLRFYKVGLGGSLYSNLEV